VILSESHSQVLNACTLLITEHNPVEHSTSQFRQLMIPCAFKDQPEKKQKKNKNKNKQTKITPSTFPNCKEKRWFDVIP